MKPRGFDTYSECRDQVLDGAIDAMTTDGSILLGYAALNPDELEVVGEPFSEERIGVGYSPDTPEMCEWINGVLEKSYDDGVVGGGLRADARQVRRGDPGAAGRRRLPRGLTRHGDGAGSHRPAARRHRPVAWRSDRRGRRPRRTSTS